MKTLVKMNFNPEIAKDVGTDSAIILENIIYWIDKNYQNQKNKETKPSYNDGDWWTYNSLEAFLGQFTWLTQDQLRTRLKNLEDKGYIKTGNYNKVRYDRTKWYALGINPFVKTQKSIWENSQIEVGQEPLRSRDNPEPIPNVKKDSSSSSRARARGKTTTETTFLFSNKEETYNWLNEVLDLNKAREILERKTDEQNILVNKSMKNKLVDKFIDFNLGKELTPSKANLLFQKFVGLEDYIKLYYEVENELPR